jgi:hypothetical protein
MLPNQLQYGSGGGLGTENHPVDVTVAYFLLTAIICARKANSPAISLCLVRPIRAFPSNCSAKQTLPTCHMQGRFDPNAALRRTAFEVVCLNNINRLCHSNITKRNGEQEDELQP